VTWYPGWDSLDSVRTWHTIFEISGIAFLALLVGAEIFAFQYGHRKDELTAVAETNAETKRKSDADAAETRRKADVDSLQEKLAAAQKAAADAAQKAKQVEARQADRRLSEEQKAAIRAAIAPYPGQKVRLAVQAGDHEAFQYAREFADIFETAKWEMSGGVVAQDFYLQPAPHGIQALVHSAQIVSGRVSVPEGIGRLVIVLQERGLITQLFSDASVESDTIFIRVGPK
jgi:hypothetical protein